MVWARRFGVPCERCGAGEASTALFRRNAHGALARRLLCAGCAREETPPHLREPGEGFRDRPMDTVNWAEWIAIAGESPEAVAEVLRAADALYPDGRRMPPQLAAFVRKHRPPAA